MTCDRPRASGGNDCELVGQLESARGWNVLSAFLRVHKKYAKGESYWYGQHNAEYFGSVYNSQGKLVEEYGMFDVRNRTASRSCVSCVSRVASRVAAGICAAAKRAAGHGRHGGLDGPCARGAVRW